MHLNINVNTFFLRLLVTKKVLKLLFFFFFLFLSVFLDEWQKLFKYVLQIVSNGSCHQSQNNSIEHTGKLLYVKFFVNLKIRVYNLDTPCPLGKAFMMKVNKHVKSCFSTTLYPHYHTVYDHKARHCGSLM